MVIKYYLFAKNINKRKNIKELTTQDYVLTEDNLKIVNDFIKGFTHPSVKPNNLLLFGPPGSGKTFLTSFLAQHLNAVLLTPSGLQETLIGSGAQNVKKLLATAQYYLDKGQNVIIFFDEADSVFFRRGSSSSHNIMIEKERTDLQNTLYQFIDGAENKKQKPPYNKKLSFILATNRLDALDPAIVRPGRAGDLIIRLAEPDVNIIRSVLEKKLKQYNLENKLDEFYDKIITLFSRTPITMADIESIHQKAIAESCKAYEYPNPSFKDFIVQYFPVLKNIFKVDQYIPPQPSYENFKDAARQVYRNKQLLSDNNGLRK